MLKLKLLEVCKKISFKNIKEFKFKKYTKFFSAFLILIIIGLTLPRGLIHAGVVGDVVMGAVYVVIYVVFMILFFVAYLIAWIGASILNMSLNPAIMNQVFANPAIYQGWSLIRDVCNLLFLLLMLLVAFGTIVQSNKYNIKNSLPKLILAIFLINFSNVIAGAIIDFGNILMYGILGWMCAVPDSCFSDYMGGLMRVIKDFNTQYSLSNAAITGVGAQQAIGIAVATIYTFMYGFILLALAAFLMVRTAGLALLLILAPFAYFGEVMPGMEKISSKWWNNIWSYTLFGPIFALMLYIAGELARMAIVVPAIPNTELGAYGTLMTTIISNSIPLLFLLAIIPITKELGLAGTDVILKNTTGLGEKISVGAAKYVGNAADRYAARGARPGMSWPRRALSNLSPGAWRRAGRAMKAEQEHDFDIAAGSHWNKLEKLPGGNKTVDRQQIAIDREVTRVMSTLSDNIAALAATNQKAKKDKDAILIEASLHKLSNTGDTAVALRADDKEESRYGLSDYMQEVKRIIGKERAEILAEDVGYNEDKDGNSGFMGFRKVYDNGTSRLRDLRDDKTYWDDDGNKKTIEEIEEIKKTNANWNDVWKTDAQWQQKSVNEKLAAKTPYERNKRLKSIALFRAGDEYDLKGNVVEEVDPKTGKRKQINTLDEQGVEYYNEIGPKNLDQVENGIKKEMKKQRDALYQFAIKHKIDKYHQEETGLSAMETAHLLKLEKAVGIDETKRHKSISREYPKNLTNTEISKETPQQKKKREDEEFEEGVYDQFATSGTGKGRIGVNKKGEVEMDEIAMKNISELADLDEETKKETFEGYRQVMLHEDEHLKPEVKNLKNPKAREIMAEAGKLAGDNYADMIDYIDKQAAAHVLADVAERGIKGMKDVKYGLGDNDFKPSDSHFVGIKPEVREEVINEMEKVRQNWVNKYEEKMKKDAEKGRGGEGGGTSGGFGGGGAGGGGTGGNSGAGAGVGNADSGAHWSEKEKENEIYRTQDMLAGELTTTLYRDSEKYGKLVGDLERIAKNNKFSGLVVREDESGKDNIGVPTVGIGSVIKNGKKKNVVYDKDTNKVHFGKDTLDNLKKLYEVDKDFAEDGVNEIVKHEKQHTEKSAAELKRKGNQEIIEEINKAKSENENIDMESLANIGNKIKEKYYPKEEIMAEVQRRVNNYKNQEEFIESDAKMHVAIDIAGHGFDKIKNIKYDTEKVNPSDLHYDFIKPKLREKIINRMEEMRQDLVNKYEEKMKKEAEKGGGGGTGGGTGGGAGASAAGGAHWSEKKAESPRNTGSESKKNEFEIIEEEEATNSLKKSEEYFKEALEEMRSYNPTVPNYYKDQSESLGNFSGMLKQEKVDDESIKFVDQAIGKNRGVMANNLRQNDMAQVYYSTPKSFGNKDMGEHKEVDLGSYVKKIKKGGFKFEDTSKKFDKIDKAIGKIGGSAGNVFGGEFEKAKDLFEFAKTSGSHKEQQAYLAMAEHTLDSIENGLEDKGIKEIVEKGLI